MPEKTAQCTTMLDGIPNDDSGGAHYLRGPSRAPATNFITRGANTVAEWIGPDCNTRPYASTGGTHMKVHRAVAGAWILMACAELTGCSSADERLPPAVTTEVA